jgi:hypothetical protein
VIGSVTEAQQQRAALETRRAAAALPEVSKPSAEAVSWAKGVLGRGYSAPSEDRIDAMHVLAAAGIDDRLYDAARQPDSAPPGARDIRAARVARDQAERERRQARKSYDDRGATEGPDQSLQPGRPEPEDYRRDYVSAGPAAESPGSEPPRVSPLPFPWGRGVPVPIELPASPAIAGHAGAITETMARHQARVTHRSPMPGGDPR